jgi:hypothetical protein
VTFSTVEIVAPSSECICKIVFTRAPVYI